MKINLIVSLLLLGALNQSDAQIYHTNPVPSCHEIDGFGVEHVNGQSTHHWIGGSGSGTQEDNCDVIGVGVMSPMNPGDFAFVNVGMDQFQQYHVEDTDFSINLSHVFNSLPAGEEVTIGQMRSEYFRVGELVLLRAPDTRLNSSRKSVDWVLYVKWYNGLGVLAAVNTFGYKENETINVNYIWDDNDPEQPVSLIYLGEKRVSVAPTIYGSYDEITNFRLGIIESDYLLELHDSITFNVNLIGQGAVEF